MQIEISREQIIASTELTIIKKLVNDDGLCREMQEAGVPRDIFKASLLQSIYMYCLDFYKEYNRAPKHSIQQLFEQLSASKTDVDMNLFGSVLASVENAQAAIDEFDYDYVFQYVNERKVSILQERLQYLLENKRPELAIKEAGEFAEIKRFQEESHCIDIIQSFSAQMAQDLRQPPQPLFRYPGVLGHLINDFYTRGAFIALLGREKVGKSWWLLDMAIRAYKQGNNVTIFQIGDMSEKQMRFRTATHLLNKPYLIKNAGEVLIPVMDCGKNKNGMCTLNFRASQVAITDPETGVTFDYDSAEEMGYRPCTECQLSPEFQPDTWWNKTHVNAISGSEYQEIALRFLDNPCKFNLLTFRNSDMLTAKKLRDALQRLQYRQDVVLIDYIDLLDSERADRHRDHDNWLRIRDCALDFDCCVITATQAAKSAAFKEYLTVDDLSEDKRKAGHVTALIGLNQKAEEKAKGQMRINVAAAREEDFHPSKQAVVLQCITLGMVHINSYLKRQS